MPRSARTAKTDVFVPPVVKPVSMEVRPRNAEFAWLREHAQEYQGQWVVLDGSELVASGPHLRDVLRRLSPAERERNPLFHWVDTD